LPREVRRRRAGDDAAQFHVLYAGEDARHLLGDLADMRHRSGHATLRGAFDRRERTHTEAHLTRLDAAFSQASAHVVREKGKLARPYAARYA